MRRSFSLCGAIGLLAAFPPARLCAQFQPPNPDELKMTEQLTYDLPAGGSVEGAPQDTKVSWEGHAVYIAKSKSDAGQITEARVLARAFDVARPVDHQDLRGFYQKAAAAGQGQLVPSVSASPAGN